MNDTLKMDSFLEALLSNKKHLHGARKMILAGVGGRIILLVSSLLTVR